MITLGWLLGIVDGDLLELGKSDGDPLGFELIVGDLLGAKLGVSENKVKGNREGISVVISSDGATTFAVCVGVVEGRNVRPSVGTRDALGNCK